MTRLCPNSGGSPEVFAGHPRVRQAAVGAALAGGQRQQAANDRETSAPSVLPAAPPPGRSVISSWSWAGPGLEGGWRGAGEGQDAAAEAPAPRDEPQSAGAEHGT